MLPDPYVDVLIDMGVVITDLRICRRDDTYLTNRDRSLFGNLKGALNYLEQTTCKACFASFGADLSSNPAQSFPIPP
jgi:hypothetical protein